MYFTHFHDQKNGNRGKFISPALQMPEPRPGELGVLQGRAKHEVGLDLRVSRPSSSLRTRFPLLLHCVPIYL